MSDEKQQTHHFGDGHDHGEAMAAYDRSLGVPADEVQRRYPDVDVAGIDAAWDQQVVRDPATGEDTAIAAVTHEDAEKGEPERDPLGVEEFREDDVGLMLLGSSIRAVDEEDILQAGRFVLDQAARGLSVSVTINGSGDTGSLTIGWYESAVTEP